MKTTYQYQFYPDTNQKMAKLLLSKVAITRNKERFYQGNA
jgi:hypothetical protein